MKKSQTKPTLKKLLEFAECAYDHTNIQTELLLNGIGDTIQNDYFIVSKDNIDSINSIKYHGMISDCADYLREIIVNSKDAKILEFSLANRPRDIDSLNNYLQTGLDDYNLKGSSYVYMAWKNRPEEYYYVGKGKTGCFDGSDQACSKNISQCKFIKQVFAFKFFPLSAFFIDTTTGHNHMDMRVIIEFSAVRMQHSR